MKIEKTTNICAKTTNGVEIKVGDSLLFTAEGKSVVGKFNGFGKRGSLEFENILDGSLFALMPKSIEKIYPAKIVVDDDFPMNKPEESEVEE